jgi:hypothetical protein
MLKFYGLRLKSNDLDEFFYNKKYNFNEHDLMYQHLLKAVVPMDQLWQHMLKFILLKNKWTLR